jgi:RNA polymerase sigma-70 factor (ECF subfamily)
MAGDDPVAARFEASRPRLGAIARRMLGSAADAEDAVQETWLRLDRVDPAGVDDLEAWLTTVTARVCLDRLRARRVRREDAGGWALADESVAAAEGDDPAHQALVADSVGAALQVVLEVLPPAERIAFVLHDVFAVPFEEVAEVVGRSPEAARKLASRARQRVRSAGTAELDLARRRQVVEAFLSAARGGDVGGLLRLLDPEVVLRPDAAALRMGGLGELRGAAAVADTLAGGARAAQLAVLDGVAGLVWAPNGRVRGAIEFRIDGGLITALDVTGDPERIRRLDVVLLG